MKFEVGKWYKASNISGKGYFKFSSWRQANKIISETCTIYDGRYSERGEISNSDWFKQVIGVPLSEILEFLPENHPDRLIKEPVVHKKEDMRYLIKLFKELGIE